MRIKLYTFFVAACLMGFLTSNQLFGQISAITYPNQACVGTTISVDFSTTVMSSANIFTIKLVPATGAPITLGTTKKVGPKVTTEVAIPTSAPAAGNYKIRVVSSSPLDSLTGTTALAIATIPPAPTVVSTISACVGTSPAPVISATGANLKWYLPSDKPLPAAPTISTAAAGEFSYQVTQTVNGCESPKATIGVKISELPTPPTLVKAPDPVCVGSAVPATTFINAVKAGSGKLVWYNVPTGGTPLEGTAITVSTSAAGVKSLYAASESGSCESTRLKVDLEVKKVPDAPVVSNVNLCVGAAAPVLTATGTNLKWYSASGAPLPAAPTIATTTAGNSKFQVSQTVNGCESPKATIEVSIHKTAPPTVTSSIEYCLNEKAAPLTATGKDLLWYTSGSGGTGAKTPPVVSTAAAGTVTYYVTQTLNGCESDRARIDIITKEIPKAPTVSDLPDVCLNTSVPAAQLLGAVSGATGSLKWYTTATGGTGTSAAPAPKTATAGVQTFYVTQTIRACESPRAAIKLDVKALPVAPSVTGTVDLCHRAPSTEALVATPIGTNTLKWYTVATGGTALTAAPVPTTTVVANTDYFVSQTQRYSATLSCEGPRAKITAVVNPLPVAPKATDQEICQTRNDQTLNYKATTTATSNSLIWYADATTATAETATPSLNLKTPGEFRYFAAQKSNKACIGPRAPVQIKVKRLPALPTVSNLEYCQFENASPLTAGLEPNATPNWYGSNPTGGTSSSTAPIPSTADGGHFSYYVSQTLQACEGDRAEIKVLIKTTPKPETQTALAYCHNAEASPLSANGQRLKWYRPNGQSQDNPFTPFTASVGDQFFYVTQTGDNNCESPKEEIKITIHPLPSATISGQSSIPLGGTASIQLSFTGMGPWTYALSNGFSGTSENSTVSIQVQPAYTTSYLVTEVSNSCGKGIPNGSALVTVLRPTVTTGNPNAINICAGSQVIVPFQQSGSFPSGSQFVLQISDQDVDETFETIPTTVSGNLLTGNLPDTLEGGTYYIRAISENPNPELSTIGSTSGVNIIVDPKPTATMPEGRTILAGQSTTLSIALTGSEPWTFSYSDGTTNHSITTSNTPYNLTVTPEQTSVFTITEIANRCGNGRSFGETRVQVDPILGVEPTVQNWVKVLPTVVDGSCTVELDVTKYDGIQLSLLDLSGRLLRKTSLNSRITEVSFSTYPSGMYFFHVQKGRDYAIIKVVKP